MSAATNPGVKNPSRDRKEIGNKNPPTELCLQQISNIGISYTFHPKKGSVNFLYVFGVRGRNNRFRDIRLDFSSVVKHHSGWYLWLCAPQDAFRHFGFHTSFEQYGRFYDVSHIYIWLSNMTNSMFLLQVPIDKMVSCRNQSWTLNWPISM